MWYESKNTYVKQVALANYVNVLLTVANIHQNLQALFTLMKLERNAMESKSHCCVDLVITSVIMFQNNLGF